MKKVMIAMSGGVDSSVAAALLKEQGYDVIGGTMHIFPEHNKDSEKIDDSCINSAVRDAKKVADKLDIPHFVFDLQDDFQKKVIDYFVDEYSQARTPNPCVMCNKKIKFSALLEKAKELDCDYIATGHYAEVEKINGSYLLKRAADINKDQTYMLYTLNQDQLSSSIFPLSNYNKDEIRKKAKELGFDIHDKKDSQEICFVPDDDYVNFLNSNYPEISKPGPIMDADGKIVGTHDGISNYTIGQRRGLGIALGYPVYVVELDHKNNAVIVGENEAVFSDALLATDINIIPFDSIDGRMAVEAQIRYNSSAVKAVIEQLSEDEIKVKFDNAQRAVTPGQSVVFYLGDLVIGGGIIKKSL